MRDSFDSLFFSSEITELCVYPFYNLSTQVQLGKKRVREWARLEWKRCFLLYYYLYFSFPNLYIQFYSSRTQLFQVFFVLLVSPVRSDIKNQFFIAEVNFIKGGDSFSGSRNFDFCFSERSSNERLLQIFKMYVYWIEIERIQ